MRFFTRIAVLFYVTLVMFLSCGVFLFLAGFISPRDIADAVYITMADENLRLVAGTFAGALLFLNFVFYQMFSVGDRSSRIIAFDNPSGRVSVSLSALEDLTRRVLMKQPEVKEVKTSIIASKRGLRIKVRLVFVAEVNIPEATSRVQEVVKKKIQTTIGMQEPIEIEIYVGKIIPERIKERPLIKKEDKKTKEEKLEPNIPFHGYRA